jgi:putative effector of murein hydrolase
MNPFRLWVYLQTTPLFWLTATPAAFLVAEALAKAAGRRPIVNHVLIAIALLGGLLKLTGTDYQTYFNGAQFVHFLLGPATVALGVPIYTNFALVKRNVWPLGAALLVGLSWRSRRRCWSPKDSARRARSSSRSRRSRSRLALRWP